MPPVDKSEVPALELATLADCEPGTLRLLDHPEPWRVQRRNGTEGSFRVRGWTDLPDGRRIVHGDYYADGSTWTADSFWYSADRMTQVT